MQLHVIIKRLWRRPRASPPFTKSSSMDGLPLELHEAILSWLPTTSLVLLMRVSHIWRELALAHLPRRNIINSFVVSPISSKFVFMEVYLPSTSRSVSPTPASMLRDNKSAVTPQNFRRERCFEVNIRIRNDTYEKKAGIVWSDDDWKTCHKQPAHYDRALEHGYECWTLTAGPISEDSVVVEYRMYVTMCGRTVWAPNPSYRVEDPVCAEKKIVLERGLLAWNPVSALCLEGRVRISDLFPKSPVVVRYSSDDWQSYSEAQCQLIHGTLWYFRVERLDPRVVRVQYCVSYDRFWDNNCARNFVVVPSSPLPQATQDRHLAPIAVRMRQPDTVVMSS